MRKWFERREKGAEKRSETCTKKIKALSRRLKVSHRHFSKSVSQPKICTKKDVFFSSRGSAQVPPDVGLAPRAAWRPLPSTPLRLRTPGWGEEGRRGRGGKGFGLREGSSNYNGGWGGPSKHQMGPDPQLGAPNLQGWPR